jgi:heme-degrading monooxygenase HmoA
VIARTWQGWTSAENAGPYEQHLRGHILPGIERLDGSRGAYLLRRDLVDGVQFMTVTLWDSLDAVRAFAGDDYEAAVVPPEARALLERFDERSVHYEVLVEPRAG